ncbi:MAG: ATP-binding protein [Betaproteobacteria bacterium]
MNSAQAAKIDPAAARIPRENEVRPPAPATGFNLSRRFALLSLVVIAVVSLTTSAVLSRFLAREMLNRDAQVSMQFIQSSTVQKNAENYFLPNADHAASREAVEDYLAAIRGMPDVIRAQLYAASGEVLWSSENAAIHQTFERNPELHKALRGNVVVEADLLESRQYIKPEHVFSALREKQFAEYYIPVWDHAHSRVIGAVEIYKSPDALFESIRTGLQLIWLCALGGGLLMYGVLFWVVRRGQTIIREQQQRIASNEGFAAVGEIAAAVAHNIRNPLAAIRSSAELMAGEPRSGGIDFAGDIMAEVDRLESWIRSLLNYAHAGTRAADAVNANDVLRVLMGSAGEEAARCGVALAWKLEENLPPVMADALMLGQIARTLVANALDAMPGGGTLTLETRSIAKGIEVVISDTGVGIPGEQLRKAFTAPKTTKLHGLGVGLPLVHRTLERMGGGIVLSSTQGRGTTVRFTLPDRVAQG